MTSFLLANHSLGLRSCTDGDGDEDLLVGAPASDEGIAYRGSVFVVFLVQDSLEYASHVKLGSGNGFEVSPTRSGLGSALASLAYAPSSGRMGAMMVATAIHMLGDTTNPGRVYVVHIRSGAQAGTASSSSVFTVTSGGMLEAGYEVGNTDGWGTSIASAGDLDGDDREELLVGAVETSGVGYVDVLWLNDAADRIVGAVRLDERPSSPLPTNLRIESLFGNFFSASTAMYDRFLAVAATHSDGHAGSVYILGLDGGSSVLEVPESHAGGDVTIFYERPPSAAGAVDALVALHHTCSPACAVGCSGGTAASCLGAVCSLGYVYNSDSGECHLPGATEIAELEPPKRYPASLVEQLDATGPSATVTSVAWTTLPNDVSAVYVATCCSGSSPNYLLLPDRGWLDIAPSSGMHLPESDTIASVWADLDLNGHADLLVLNRRGLNSRFFVHTVDDIAEEMVLTSSVEQWRGFGDADDEVDSGIAVGDCDGDRDLDVYITRPEGTLNSLHLNLLFESGTAAFDERGGAAGVTDVRGDGGTPEWLDVDADGDLDILIVSSSGPPRLFANDGSCSFTDVSVAFGVTRPGFPPSLVFQAGAIIGDWNGDGLLDAAIASVSGELLALIWDPVDAAYRSELHNSSAALTGSVGDVDADGVGNLVLGGVSGLHVLQFDGGANASLVDVSQTVLEYFEQSTGAVSAVCIHDVDRDGGLDILSFSSIGNFVRHANSSVVPHGSDPWLLSVRLLHRLGVQATQFGAWLSTTLGAVYVDGGSVVNVYVHEHTADFNVSFAALTTPSVAVNTPRSPNATTVLSLRDEIRIVNISAHPAEGIVAIGHAITLLIEISQSGLLLSPLASVNNRGNADSALSSTWQETSAGVYSLTHVVTAGDPDWPEHRFPMHLILQDTSFYRVVTSRPFPWPKGAACAAGDGTRPIAYFDITPSVFSKSSDAHFTLTCSELGCAYSYQLDDGAWIPVTASQGEGGAGDDAGGRPTSLEVLARPPRRSRSTTAEFSFRAFVHDAGDPVPRIEYRIDTDVDTDSLAAGWVLLDPGASDVVLAQLADGPHVLQARAGPADPAPLTLSWNVDTLKPEITAIDGPGVVLTSRRAVYRVDASEADCVIRYRVVRAPLADPAVANGVSVFSVLPTTVNASNAALWDSFNTSRIGTVVLEESDLFDGFAHRVEFALEDQSGNVGTAWFVNVAIPRCTLVPGVLLDKGFSTPDGKGAVAYFVAEESVERLDVRRVDGGVVGEWRVTDFRTVVVDFETDGAAQEAPGVQHAIEVRAHSRCRPHLQEPPPPARFEWAEPPDVHGGAALGAVLVEAPSAVTTQRNARFNIPIGRPTDSLLQCAYGYAPPTGGDGNDSPIVFVGGERDGELPLWKPCTAGEFVVGTLAVGRHRLLARAVHINSGETTGSVISHDWTVQTNDASSFDLAHLELGPHTVAILAVDSAGNEQTEDTIVDFTWSVDRTPPVTHATVQNAAFGFINGSVVEVAATCYGEEFVEYCEFCWTMAPLNSSVALTGCDKLVDGTLRLVIPESPAWEGATEVHVRAIDGAGNEDAVGATDSWVTDRVPPSLELSLVDGSGHPPIAGVVYTSSAFPVVRAAATEPLRHIDVAADGIEARIVVDGAEPGGDEQAELFLLADGEGVAQHGDVFFLTAFATDLAGSVGEPESLRVIVDMQPPAAPTLTSVVSVSGPRRVNSTDIVVSVAGPTASNELLWGFDLEVITHADPWVAIATGRRQLQAWPDFVPVNPIGVVGRDARVAAEFSNLQDGMVYTVVGSSVDLAGLRSDGLIVDTFAVDTTPPTLNLESDFIATNDNLAIELATTCSEPGCVICASVWRSAIVGDDEPALLQQCATAPSLNSGDPLMAAYPQTLSIETSVELEDDDYTVLVGADDAAGNAAESPAAATVVVDTDSPHLEATLPFAGSFTTHARFHPSVSCTDRLLCNIDIIVSSGTAQIDAAGDIIVDEEGLNSIRVSATDAAGNAAAAVELSWVFDVTPPHLVSDMWLVTAPTDADDDGFLPDATAPTAPPIATRDSHAAGVDGETEEEPSALNAFSLRCVVVRVTCVEQRGSDCGVSLRLKFVGASTGTCESGGSSTDGGVTSTRFDDWAPVVLDHDPDTNTGEAVVQLFPLADGLWELDSKAVDEAGNLQNSSTTVSWWVDTVAPPAPQLTSDVENIESTGVSDVLQFTVVASFASDSPLPLETVVVYTVGTTEEPGVARSVPATGASDASGQLSASLPVGDESPLLDGGKYVLVARVVDAAGNSGPPETKRFSVQATAPDTRVVSGPAAIVGLETVRVRISALSSTGEPLTAFRHIEVSLNSADPWTNVCGEEGTPGERVPPSDCIYDVLAPDPIKYVLQARAVNALGQRDLDPPTIGWEKATCTGQQFAIVNRTNGGLVCVQCPVGADCTDTMVEQHEVSAREGFWQPDGSFEFYKCTLDSCLGSTVNDDGTVTPSRCADGYAGRLCSLCADGWFMQFRRCVPCPDSQGASVGVLVGIAIALVVSGALLFRIRHLLPVAVGKVVVSFLQVVGSANTAFRITWPEAFEETMNSFKVAMLDILTLTRASCAAPMSFYDSFTVTLVLFIGFSVAGIVGMTWHDGKMRRQEQLELDNMLRPGRTRDNSSDSGVELSVMRPSTDGSGDGVAPLATHPRSPARRAPRPSRGSRRRSTLARMPSASRVVEMRASLQSLRWSRVFSALSMFWLLCYPGVSVKMMRVFKCIEVQDAWWLEADMRLECFTPAWSFVAFIAVVVLVIYTAGLPLGITLWLRSRRHALNDANTKLELGFLYVPAVCLRAC